MSAPCERGLGSFHCGNPLMFLDRWLLSQGPSASVSAGLYRSTSWNDFNTRNTIKCTSGGWPHLRWTIGNVVSCLQKETMQVFNITVCLSEFISLLKLHWNQLLHHLALCVWKSGFHALLAEDFFCFPSKYLWQSSVLLNGNTAETNLASHFLFFLGNLKEKNINQLICESSYIFPTAPSLRVELVFQWLICTGVFSTVHILLHGHFSV